MSKTIKLNRNQLVNLISESVNRIINESDYMDDADAYEQNNPYKRELQAYMHGWNQEKGRFDTPMSMFKDELDKRWQDTKDLEKASRMANSRPLHRKRSLNRDIKESVDDDCDYCDDYFYDPNYIPDELNRKAVNDREYAFRHADILSPDPPIMNTLRDDYNWNIEDNPLLHYYIAHSDEFWKGKHKQ